MKGGTRAAVAIGVGYVLGRRRKMRLATVLAVGAATGGIGALGGSAMRRGAQALSSTDALGKLGPQVGEIADTLRGDLLDAGKAAAMAAVTGRVDALTDSLHERAESIRNPAEAAAGAGEAARERVGRGRQAARPSGRRRGRDEDRQEADDEELEDYGSEDDEPDDYEPDDEPEDDEDAGARSRPSRGRRRGSRDRAPVTRARR